MSALRAFVACAEWRSFSRAGTALGVTHSAVIHQVRALEAHVGAKLVISSGGGLQLTDAGTDLMMRVGGPMRSLERSFSREARLGETDTLTVEVMSSLAQGWLARHLAQIAAVAGGRIDLRLAFALGDHLDEDVDVAIRWGGAVWPGLTSSLLAEDRRFPAASPSFAGLRSLRGLTDLRRVPLIENAYGPWGAWLEETGAGNLPLRIAYSVADSYTAQILAEHGAGVALVRQSIASEALRARRLVRVLQPCERPSESVWMLWRPGSRRQSLFERLAAVFRQLFAG